MAKWRVDTYYFILQLFWLLDFFVASATGMTGTRQKTCQPASHPVSQFFAKKNFLIIIIQTFSIKHFIATQLWLIELLAQCNSHLLCRTIFE